MKAILTALVVTSCTALGCIGPSNIVAERQDFSSAIALTNRQQVLLNIVRVHYHEQPQFVDVSSITNQSQFTGSVTGSAGFPQATGSLGSIGGHVGHDYTPGFTIGGYDQPAITYLPLTGQPLVQQIVQPITVDSIAALFDSDWPIRSVLTLVADKISPRPGEDPTIIDAIHNLKVLNVLTVVAVKSPATGGSGGNDSLVFFCDPDVLTDKKQHEMATSAWKKLRLIYGETYVDPLTIGPKPAAPAKMPAEPGSPFEYSIELRTAPATQPALPAREVIPQLRTRSALGVLAKSTDDTVQYFSFMGPRAYAKLWKDDQDKLFYQYVPFSIDAKISADEQDAGDLPDILEADQRVKTAESQSKFLPEDPNQRKKYIQSQNGVMAVKGSEDADSGEINNAGSRHFMAVVVSLSPPRNSYACVKYQNRYYYIDDKDLVSQRSFQLVTQLLNLQSVVPTTPAPTPTISVGGH